MHIRRLRVERACRQGLSAAAARPPLSLSLLSLTVDASLPDWRSSR